MDELYKSMEDLLIMQDNLNALIKIIDSLSETPEDNQSVTKGNYGIIKLVLSDVLDIQISAAAALDEYIAKNASDKK